MTRTAALVAVRALLSAEQMSVFDVLPEFVLDVALRPVVTGLATPEQAAEALAYSLDLLDADVDERAGLEIMQALAERHNGDRRSD